MTELAERLARMVHPNPDARLITSIVADTELMAVAKTDIDAAAKMLIDLAIDTLTVYVAAKRDTLRKAA